MNPPATPASHDTACGRILLSTLGSGLETAQHAARAGLAAASDPGITEPEWLPAGQDLQDVAPQLRLLLASGTSFAIATVLDARGTALRRPGTVIVVSQSGQAIGFNPAGPLDGAIRELAAEALATGHDQLERLEIDREAASYIGPSGGVRLDVHATQVPAGDRLFGHALRYLDSGAATVLAIGTCGVSGHAVISADRVVGRLGRPELPAQIITGARSMLGSHRAVHTTYRLGRESGGTRVQIWMQSQPGW
jgi:hypothetical protein